MKKKIILRLSISILILAITAVLASCAPAATTPTPPAPATPAKPVEEKPPIEVVKPAPETPTPTPPPPPTSTSTSTPKLENTTWKLQSYGQPGNLKSALPDTEVTALFDSAKGRVAGSAGVNTYGGGYELKDNKLAIPGPLASTRMAGPQPLMDQETEFLKLFQVAESYQIKDGQLQVNCGQQVLIFTEKARTSTPAPALENITWVLQSYGQPGNLISVLKDRDVTAVFDSAKGRVSGSAGVNTYGGGYELRDNRLSIPGPLVSTLMAGPQPLMEQEKEYLTALQAAESYKIEGDKLTITCGGKALIFTKK